MLNIVKHLIRFENAYLSLIQDFSLRSREKFFAFAQNDKRVYEPSHKILRILTNDCTILTSLKSITNFNAKLVSKIH
jgi:hypothetical protein